MRYAIVENRIVTNIIWLHPMNAADFPAAVPMGDVPAGIGDTWDGAHFYRDGKRVLTQLDQQKAEADATIAELDAALLDITYQSIMGGLEE